MNSTEQTNSDQTTSEKNPSDQSENNSSNNDDNENQTNLRQVISDLKKQHLNEISELRNQLDEVRTKATIIETTKQDEIDEIKFKHKQEIDSLNHIINALQSDLNTMRHEYESLGNNFKEFKRQVQLVNTNEMKSPVSSGPTSLANRLNLSPFGSSSKSNHNINQENENLEEDMRKAKESAEMLRSVVLPLETEISKLRSRSNTSDQKIKELEKIIDDKDKEKQKMLDEEQQLIQESISTSYETDLENFNLNSISIQQTNTNLVDSVYFKKYIKLKKYLKKNENKFLELEQSNLRSIKQIYSLLTAEQKIRLIPNRSKSKSLSAFSYKSDDESKKNLDSKKLNETEESDGFVFEQNETISKIEELLDYLTLDQTINVRTNEDNFSLNNKSVDTTSSNEVSISTTNNESMMQKNFNNINNYNPEQVYNYAELLAMYEKERNYRINYLEPNFNQQAVESKEKIEELNKELTNFANLIDSVRKDYSGLQQQYKTQMEQLIKINEDLRNENKTIESTSERIKQENLKLKAENKQFYGDQSILVKEIDEQYQNCSNLEEAQRQNSNLRQELVKLIIANQALHKQHSLSLENLKHLHKVNTQYQNSTNMQEQIVITQSLESELERERKVRLEAESELQEYKAQLLVIKERGQSLVESLKQRNEQNDFEIRKLKEDNQELQNQIQSLKQDSKNSLSVQEDLVRLIQSLQIELNQTKANSGEGEMRNGPIEVRCQHEDDFNECAECRCLFSVTKRKHRCKHCCKIFCADCCSKTVYTGPNLRPHKVCSSCHTLLDKDTSHIPNTNST